MTTFNETLQKTVSGAKKERNRGWTVTFKDGSCRFIPRDLKKGFLAIKPGKVMISCVQRCKGPDENGMCTWQPSGQRKPYISNVVCNKQFVYFETPRKLNREHPKIEIMKKHRARRIKSIEVIKDRRGLPIEFIFEFETGEKQTVQKSQILGHNAENICQAPSAFIGFQLIPCEEECGHKGETCVHCKGIRKGTPCDWQFYFCRKFPGRHR